MLNTCTCWEPTSKSHFLERQTSSEKLPITCYRDFPMKQRKAWKYWLLWDLLADVQGSTEGKNSSSEKTQCEPGAGQWSWASWCNLQRCGIHSSSMGLEKTLGWKGPLAIGSQVRFPSASPHAHLDNAGSHRVWRKHSRRCFFPFSYSDLC